MIDSSGAGIDASLETLATIRSTFDATTEVSTRQAYAVAQRGWLAHCRRHGWAAVPTSAADESAYIARVVSYLQAKFDAGAAASTIVKTLAGMRFYAADESTLATRALATSPALKRFNARVARALRDRAVKQAAAFTVDDLAAMHQHLAAVGTVKALRDRALLGLGVGAALRSEALAALNMGDVSPAVSIDGRVLHLRSRGADQDGEGRLVPVRRSQNTVLDPVAALDAWVQHLRAVGFKDSDPLFPRIRGTVVQHARIGRPSEALTELIRGLVVEAGVAGTDGAVRYSSFSMRGTFMSLSAQAQVPEADVARVTGRRSTTAPKGDDRTSPESAGQTRYLGD